MGFFNDFKKSFQSAEHSLSRVVRTPLKFLGPITDNPISNTIRDNPAVQFLGDHLNPQKAVQKIIDNPQQAGKIAEVMGGVLSAIGLPEVGVPLALTGGALEATVSGAQQVSDGIDKGDIKKIVGGLGKIGTSVNQVRQELNIDFKTLDFLEKEENIKIQKLIGQTKQIATYVKAIDQQIGISNKLLGEEIMADKTHNEQMDEFIRENHGENEAIKHGQVIIDKELQKIESVEEAQEDSLNQIKTLLDKPVSEFDIAKDMENFIDPKAVLEYLAENLATLNALSDAERDILLDLAIAKGVLNSI